MKQHLTTEESFGMPAKDLATKIGDLRYDDMVALFLQLALKLKTDSQADAARGRPRLATHLLNASKFIRIATQDIKDAWDISAPHMPHKKPLR